MAREESPNRGPLNKSLNDRRERDMQILREEPSSKGAVSAMPRDGSCPDRKKAHVVDTGQTAVSRDLGCESDYPEPQTRIGSRIVIEELEMCGSLFFLSQRRNRVYRASKGSFWLLC